jgi:hypothetical protein
MRWSALETGGRNNSRAENAFKMREAPGFGGVTARLLFFNTPGGASKEIYQQVFRRE